MTAARPADCCPSCGRATAPSHLHPNQPSLCQSCTEQEIGCTFEELRARVSAMRSKKRKWSL